jgi:hypothetical protein
MVNGQNCVKELWKYFGKYVFCFLDPMRHLDGLFMDWRKIFFKCSNIFSFDSRLGFYML